MLELATLGLLQTEPLHGYRLKQQLELFMSCCISVNYGAIYPLLRRLEERGEIVTLATDQTEGGGCRKTYCITSKGRDRWREKMLENPHESWVNNRSRFMIKFFFFSHLEPIQRVKLLKNRLNACHLRLESIEFETTHSLDPYASIAWNRSIDVLRSEIQWLDAQLAKEEKELCDSDQPAKTQGTF
jgi:DNA-binding PadR family transcriptional regulator